MNTGQDEKQSTKKNKTTKSRRETAVQGTNDSSIVSKCSMAAQGYFEDEFLQGFVSKVTRRAPLIHRGYYIRAKTIDFILKTFIAENTGPKQIISLGAGFDSAYFRLHSKGLLTETVFFEVDFPEVVKRKCALIKDNPAMLMMVGESNPEISRQSPLIEMSTKTYNLLGVDLSQTNTLEAALKLCDVDLDKPTLLMSECVLTYMTRRCASAVVKWAAETFCNSTFVLYEQINPNDAFGLFMQQHFHTVGSPLKSINYFPTIQSQKERFQQLGWSEVQALAMNQFYFSLLAAAERRRVENLEPFDEYEEWHLKCAHYMVLCGYHGNCNPLLSGTDKNSEKADVISHDGMIRLSMSEQKSSVKRFGHGACTVDNRLAVSVGGFGEQLGKHMRVTDMTFTNLLTMETQLIDPGVINKVTEVSRMHATLSCLSDGQMILIGGRLSPMKLCTQVVSIQVEYEMMADTDILKDAEEISCEAMNCDKKLNCEAMNVDDKANCEAMNCGDQVNFEAMNCDDQVNCINSIVGSAENFNAVSKSINSASNNNEPIQGSDQVNNNEENDANCVRNGVKMNCASNEINSVGSNSMEREVSGKKVQLHCGNPSNNGDAKYEVIDARNKVVTGVKLKVLEQQGDLPCPRWRHSAVLYKKDGEECVIVYGGRTQTAQALGDCYMYCPDSSKWTKIVTQGLDVMPRHSHTASLWNNQMVIANGLDDDLKPLNDVHLLDLNSWTWTKLDCDIRPRYSHTAHVIEDFLVLVGGVSLSHLPLGVAIIHLPSGHSVEFSLPEADKDRLLLLHRHTSVMLDSCNVMVLGGGGNCFSFGTLLNSSPVILDITDAKKMITEQIQT